MYRYFVLFVCLLILGIGSTGAAQQQSGPSSFAIEHVTVINVANGTRSADQTVVVTGNRIAAVGSASSIRIPAAARVVDGRGKFLMPGLWDMHVHVFHNLPARTLPFAVANGVTGIREMGGSIAHMAEARKLIDDGLVAPRLIASGPALDGIPQGTNFPPGTDLSVFTPDEGRQVVNRLVAQKVDFLKVHNQLSRETFLAIADEAKRWKVPFDGHLSVGVSITDASDAGQRTIEHMAALGPSCVADPVVLRPPAANTTPPTEPIVVDRAKCEQTLRHLVRNGTWFSPTIGSPGSGNARIRTFNLALIQMAARAGVKLLAGTDWPGAGYWRGNYANVGRTPQGELAGLVEAGLTPAEALRTATVNPAALLNMSDQLGSVETGKLADLLLLDADPLLNVANASRISAVVVNGRLIDSAMRQKLLDDETAAQKATSRSN
jgi:imidazolonepropionase-like amidohydrolase